MEHRPDRFTALIDANALAPALQRNLILSLAEAGLFRPRWSSAILDEFERAVLRAARDATPALAADQRRRIERAFPEGLVEGWEGLRATFAAAPDPDDAHVMAAAQRCGAAVIVTANVKDFPPALLAPLDIEAVAPDDFLADAIDIDQEAAVAAIRLMRGRLRRPELSAEALVTLVRERGLAQTADLLVPHAAAL